MRVHHRGLSWRAEHLLLALLLLVGLGGSVEGDAASLARLVGFAKRQDVYQAAQELAVQGWLRKEGGGAGRGGRMVLVEKPPLHEFFCTDTLPGRGLLGLGRSPRTSQTTEVRLDSLSLSIRVPEETEGTQSAPAQTTPGLKASELDEVSPIRDSTSVPRQGHQMSPTRDTCPPLGTPDVPDEGHQMSPVRDISSSSPRPRSLLARITEVDRMASGNDRMRGPFQERRRAQVPLVQEAWATFFPTQPPLTTTNAKVMLNFCDDSAEEVYEQLRDLTGRTVQNPLTYGITVMKNQARERHASVTAPAPVPSPSEPTHWSDTERADWERRQEEAIARGIREGWYIPEESAHE